MNKRRYQRSFRRRTYAQHARFLDFVPTLSIELDENADAQTNFDTMYRILLDLLDTFYPEREITVTSSDPSHVTPTVKALLRRKNRLMRAGRTDEAGSIAVRIRTIITCSSTRWLWNVDPRKNAKVAWAKVRDVTEGSAFCTGDHLIDGLTAQLLNNHYAAISTDNGYCVPRPKLTAFDGQSHFTEITVFRMLDTLHSTAMGLDQIPAWFLHLGAPIFAAPLARVFDQSLATGIVPQQWKTAVISPLPKIPMPTQESDFRPISVMSVLLCTLERFVVRTYIYPALLQPYPTLDFSDQFAFWPSGSTTAAIVALLDTVRTMLDENDVMHIFSFDFSKAFDTGMHH